LTPQSAVQENNQIETFVPKPSACINIKTRSWFGSKIYCEKKILTLTRSYEMALYVKVEARDYETKSHVSCFLLSSSVPDWQVENKKKKKRKKKKSN
jgi:hypothetical protein